MWYLKKISRKIFKRKIDRSVKKAHPEMIESSICLNLFKW